MKSLDEKKNTIQDNGVMLEVDLLQFLTSKYQNLIGRSMLYSYVIEKIWKVGYIKFFVLVFKCKLVDNKSDVKINE